MNEWFNMTGLNKYKLLFCSISIKILNSTLYAWEKRRQNEKNAKDLEYSEKSIKTAIFLIFINIHIYDIPYHFEVLGKTQNFWINLVAHWMSTSNKKLFS